MGAVLAALAGGIDLGGIERGPVRRLGTIHMVVNLLAVAMSAGNFAIRWGMPDHSGPRPLTLAVVALIGFSGWLGGELVYVHRVGMNAGSRRDS